MRNFETWETQDVELLLGITQQKHSALLSDWLSAAPIMLSDLQHAMLENLRETLLDNADFWNEDELKLQFIAPILQIVGYQDVLYKPFSQRKIMATINSIPVGGWVDYMVASGKQKPIQPYFFLHEYKQERKGKADPKGQLLAELLVAQALNQQKIPVYGCYVVGRNWFFVVLEGKIYAVSDAFVATQDDLYQILNILCKVKVYIAQSMSII
jgi:hypothetical protein